MHCLRLAGTAGGHFETQTTVICIYSALFGRLPSAWLQPVSRTSYAFSVLYAVITCRKSCHLPRYTGKPPLVKLNIRCDAFLMKLYRVIMKTPTVYILDTWILDIWATVMHVPFCSPVGTQDGWLSLQLGMSGGPSTALLPTAPQQNGQKHRLPIFYKENKQTNAVF